MILYKYKALSMDGKIIRGRYFAKNSDAVTNMLRRYRFTPITVEEVGKYNFREMFVSEIKVFDIAIFCRQFYVAINSGIPLLEALTIIGSQIQNPALKKALKIMIRDIKSGAELSDAMLRHERILPKLLINMTKAGEYSGRLEVIFEKLSAHYEKENKINMKIKNAMVYPVVLVFSVIAVLISLFAFIMPQFISMLEINNAKISEFTVLLIDSSKNLVESWYLTVMIIIFVVLVVIRAFRIKVYFIDQLKFMIPVFTPIYNKIIAGRFARTFSILLASSVPMLDSISIASAVVQNAVVSKQLNTVKKDVQRGIPLAAAFKKVKIFPSMLHSMIKIGEDTGELTELLGKAANFYDEQAEMATARLVSVIEPILIVVMAVIVAFIVISVITPTLNMLDVLG